MSIHVRRATAKDLELIAWTMLSASRSQLDRGIWEYLYALEEPQTLQFLRRVATSETVHMFHHSLFLIAELDGEPGAAMCGYDSSTQGPAAFGPVAEVVAPDFGFDIADTECQRRLGVMMSGFAHTADLPPRTWTIENVATRPELRRRGLVDALLHQLLGHGRERGFEHAQIGVYLENERARRAYVKAGFEVVSECRSPEWEAELGCPGTELMLQEL